MNNKNISLSLINLITYRFKETPSPSHGTNKIKSLKKRDESL